MKNQKLEFPPTSDFLFNVFYFMVCHFFKKLSMNLSYYLEAAFSYRFS